jgi:hypothetical protein
VFHSRYSSWDPRIALRSGSPNDGGQRNNDVRPDHRLGDKLFVADISQNEVELRIGAQVKQARLEGNFVERTNAKARLQQVFAEHRTDIAGRAGNQYYF